MQTLDAASFEVRQRTLDDQLEDLLAAVSDETTTLTASGQTPPVSGKRLQNRLLELHTAAKDVNPRVAEPVGELLVLTAKRWQVTPTEITKMVTAVRSALAEAAGDRSLETI